jgi:hypothetical protein
MRSRTCAETIEGTSRSIRSRSTRIRAPTRATSPTSEPSIGSSSSDRRAKASRDPGPSSVVRAPAVRDVEHDRVGVQPHDHRRHGRLRDVADQRDLAVARRGTRRGGRPPGRTPRPRRARSSPSAPRSGAQPRTLVSSGS